LHDFAANLFRKLFAKFHQNRRSFVGDITKKRLVSFFRKHCSCYVYEIATSLIRPAMTTSDINIISYRLFLSKNSGGRGTDGVGCGLGRGLGPSPENIWFFPSPPPTNRTL